MKKTCWLLIFCFGGLVTIQAEDTLPHFFMAFHACDKALADCHKPDFHQVYVAESSDGVTWSLLPNWQPYMGSVPDVIQRDNTLYIYTARQELVTYDLLTQTQTPPERFQIKGLPVGFVDPSLYLNEDGLLELFGWNGFVKGGDPARCAPDQATCEKYVDSATEVLDSAGKEFVLSEGHRITITIPSDDYESASDPDIFAVPDGFVLYLSHGMSFTAWTAPTLLAEYAWVGFLSEQRGGVPAGYYDEATERYWSYAHFNQNGVSVIRRAVHETLDAPLTDWEIVLTAEILGLSSTTNVESPSITAGQTAP